MSLIEPYLRAPEKLKPSRLTVQLEALGDEIDVNSLNLSVDGKTALQIRQSITAASISRTIQGASQLTITLQDADLSITQSGVFGRSIALIPDSSSLLTQGVAFARNVDCELDGLWFRLVGWSKPTPASRSITLTFEDREVNVLRSYPKLSFPGEAPNPLTYMVFAPSMTRIQVMQWLIGEAVEFGPKGPRISSPLLPPSQPPPPATKQDPVKRQVGHSPGFPLFGPAGITIKGAAPDTAQLSNISAVLDEGMQKGVASVLLQAAIMTITQESSANASATNGIHVGLFQQDPRYWPATRDPSTDAAAFFDRAITDYNKNPGQSLGALCAQVQGNPNPEQYAQWQIEAGHTVAVWSGTDETIHQPGNLFGPSGQPDTGAAPGAASPAVPATPMLVGTALFTRGQQSNEAGKTVVTRENNWDCLQRLAQEVGWLVYCVSGTIYIEDWQHLSQQAVRFQFTEDDPGIDGIGCSIDTGQANANASVECRISRWGAPPGTIVKINDLGPAAGKWIVQTIERDLFSTAGTITLQKPQSSLPATVAESASPVQGIQILQTSGTTTSGAAKIVAGDSSSVRASVVAAARKALASAQNYRWAEVRPMPSSLFGTPPIVTDCSGFATLCYKAADAPDPNGPLFNYNGEGDTASLVANGTATQSPQPGDLIFYGSLPKPDHVVVFVGAGQVISLGSTIPKLLPIEYRTDLLGAYTYNMGIPG